MARRRDPMKMIANQTYPVRLPGDVIRVLAELQVKHNRRDPGDELREIVFSVARANGINPDAIIEHMPTTVQETPPERRVGRPRKNADAVAAK